MYSVPEFQIHVLLGERLWAVGPAYLNTGVCQSLTEVFNSKVRQMQACT